MYQKVIFYSITFYLMSFFLCQTFYFQSNQMNNTHSIMMKSLNNHVTNMILVFISLIIIIIYLIITQKCYFQMTPSHAILKNHITSPSFTPIYTLILPLSLSTHLIHSFSFPLIIT